jgi:hypothetical protein
MAAVCIEEVCRDFDCSTDELTLLAELSLADAEQQELDDEFDEAFEEDLDDFVDDAEFESLVAEEEENQTVQFPCRNGDACRFKAAGTCRFSHTPTPCRNGDACRFKAAGTCRFVH